MNFLEKAKLAMASEEFSEGINNFTKNIISAATGDVVAAAEALEFILKSPMFIRECLFWERFSMFLDGVFLDDNDIERLLETIGEKIEQENYARKIIKVIDDIDANAKIAYLINLTRALLAGYINKPDYFRLINAVKSTLDEDLVFLSNTIGLEHLKANIHFEFLKQNGLAIQYAISDDGRAGGDEYIFTPLAYALDQYGLNYENGKYQYSISTKSLSEQPVPVTKAGSIAAKWG